MASCAGRSVANRQRREAYNKNITRPVEEIYENSRL